MPCRVSRGRAALAERQVLNLTARKIAGDVTRDEHGDCFPRKGEPVIIFFSGLPKAGKSVTLGAIYDALRGQGRSFFLERICPDCEGMWTLATEKGTDRARALKNVLKNAGEFFSPAFVEAKQRAIQGLARCFDVVLCDMGGIPSPENAAFVDAASCTGKEVRAVVLHVRGTDPTPWVEWWKERGICPVVHETVRPYDDRFENAQALLGVFS